MKSRGSYISCRNLCNRTSLVKCSVNLIALLTLARRWTIDHIRNARITFFRVRGVFRVYCRGVKVSINLDITTYGAAREFSGGQSIKVRIDLKAFSALARRGTEVRGINGVVTFFIFIIDTVTTNRCTRSTCLVSYVSRVSIKCWINLKSWKTLAAWRTDNINSPTIIMDRRFALLIGV